MKKEDLLVAALLLAVSILFQMGCWSELADDAYITLRYSENVAVGIGWAYNEGERISGSTSPLWTLLLASGARAGASPVAVAKLLGALFLFLAAYLTYRFLSAGLGALPAATAGIVTIVSAANVSSAGLEFPLLIFLGALSIRLHLRRRSFGAAFALGLMLLTRGDAVLLAAVILADMIARERRLPWREVIVIGLFALPWAAFSALYFGSPLPQTLHAKIAQFESGFWYNTYPLKMWKIAIRGALADPLLVLFYPLAAAGIFLRDRAVRLVLFWSLLYAVSYTLLGVPGYIWYCLIPLYGLGVVASAGIGLIEKRSAGKKAALIILALLVLVNALIYPLSPLLLSAARYTIDARLRASPKAHPPSFYYERAAGLLNRARRAAGFENAYIALACLLLVLGLWVSEARSRQAAPAWTIIFCVLLVLPRIHEFSLSIKKLPSPRMLVYRSVGEWLSRNTPRGASVAADEIGMIGYYSKRRIVDCGGIVTPSIARDLARGERTSWLFRYEPDFVLLQGLWIFEEPVEELASFRAAYEELRSWPRGSGLRVRLFARMRPLSRPARGEPLAVVRRWDFSDHRDAAAWRITDPSETRLAGRSPEGRPIYSTSGEDSSLECETRIDPAKVSLMKVRMRITPHRGQRKASVAYLRWRGGTQCGYPPLQRASFSTKGTGSPRTYTIDLGANRAWPNVRPIAALKITPTTVASEMEFEDIELLGPRQSGHAE